MTLSRERLRLGAVAVLCSLGMTLLYTAQHAALQATMGLPIAWSNLVGPQLIHWGVWAVLTPVIVMIVDRYRLDVERRAGRVAILLLVGVALSVAQAVVATALIIRFSSPPYVVAGSVAGGQVVVLHGQALPNGAEIVRRAQTARTISTIGPNLVIFLLIVGVLHAALYYGDIRRRRLRESDLEARLARAELGALRAQLQPHFLFNTMHTVSSLMTHDVPAARRVLAALGDLLRLSIEQMHRQEVPLGEELDFIARYVEIQRARFHDRVRVVIDVPDDAKRALVPNLVLQPLVENAIRHGIEPHTRAGTVWITARRDGDRLVLTIRDDGPDDPVPRRSREGAREAHTGVGLANIQARLAQLYDSAHEFSAGRHPSGGFEVLLAFPFRVDGPAPARRQVPA